MEAIGVNKIIQVNAERERRQRDLGHSFEEPHQQC